MKLRKHLAVGAAAATFAFGASAAHATLVFLNQADLQGTGLGNVNTLLTLQSPGSTTSATGTVMLNAAGAQTVTGNTVGINQTRTIAETGATSASGLRIVFNASEPQNAQAQSVTLSNLQLGIFSPTGQVLFNSGAWTAAQAQAFNTTLPGVGSAGFVFGLDAAQASQAQAAFGNPQNVIGLSATVNNATGGPETFFVTTAAAGGGVGGIGGEPVIVGPIPEPATIALLGSGLLAMGGLARRRRNR